MYNTASPFVLPFSNARTKQTAHASKTPMKGLEGLFDPYPFPWWIPVASSGASAYHGYKRNRSVGGAVLWGVLGGIFPIITPVVAIAQGFGKRKHR